MAIYLFHSSLSPVTASRGIQYDEALRLNKEGHTVYFLFCNGLMSQCFNNIIGDRANCYKCISNFKEEKRKFGNRINFIPMTSFLDNSEILNIKKEKFIYNNIDEIKNLKYKDINIGFGSLSGYITKSRNLSPLIDDDFKYFFDQNLYNSILTIEAVIKAIKIYSPDHIVLYNGRFADSRPVWQLAKKFRIPYTTLEAVNGLNRKFKSIFHNSTPHSIEKNTELIKYFWSNSILDLNERIRIGSSFFEKRKNAEYAGDKIYTKNQIKNLLPNNWDSSKKNIVIFNSSEDEFAAIGDEYDKYKLFNSQLDGLEFIKTKLADNGDVNVTLRVHPNLSNIQYSYATELDKLKSDNFDVIEASSKISSYALIDNADIVVVFGSTIGVESVYWNKPTILLAGALYYKLDCCYIPNTRAELIELLMSDLEPKNRNQSIKFGYYIMNEEMEGPSIIDFNWTTVEVCTIRKKKKTLTVFNWKKLLNSRILYVRFNNLRFKLINLFYRFKKNKGIRFKLPVRETVDNK